MLSKKTKRTGGPKTPEGRAKVSNNAIKHGLTASTMLDDRQIMLVDQFVKELTQYYKPKSPLEKMYIERIAQTRAKLQKLTEVESLGVMLTKTDLLHRPEQVLNRFTHISDAVKQIALNLILDKGYRFPIGLSEQLLESLCKEVDQMQGLLINEEDLPRKLPQLAEFLTNVQPFGDDEKSKLSVDSPLFLDNQLRLCVAKIELDRYSSADPITGEDKLARMEQIVFNLAQEKSVKEMTARAQKRSSKVVSYQVIFSKDFDEFKTLWIDYKQAKALTERVRTIIELTQSAAILPEQEMDKMMRYQTTLERRLSSLTGEFLAIRGTSI